MSEEKPISALMLTERPAQLRARYEAVIAKPDLLERICDHVANGGSLVQLCRMWLVSYAKIMRWIKAQPAGKELYDEALKMRDEFADEMVKSDLYTYAQADVRQLFGSDGVPISPADLSDEIAPAIQSIKVKERIYSVGNGETETERTIEFTMVDKLKSRDMLNRMAGRYVDKHEHSGSVNLVDILSGSYTKDVSGSKP